MAVVLALVLGLPAFGISAYLAVARQQKADAFAALQSIVDLKANQISGWLGERSADGLALARSPEFIELVLAAGVSGDGSARERLRGRLSAVHEALGYQAISLLDGSGRILLEVGAPAEVTPAVRNLLPRALQSGAVQTDALTRDNAGQLHLDFVVPIPAIAGSALPGNAALVLHVDPAQYLYPLIQAWPTASASGEFLLMRPQDGRVLYLNELRFRRGTALVLDSTLDAPGPAASAVRLGRPGIAEGADYRTVPVLAAYRPVGQSGWMLLAKIDTAEAMAPARALAVWVSLMAALALTILAAVTTGWWRQRQRSELLLRQAQDRALLEPFFHLPFIGMAVRSGATGQWLRLNDRLCEILGYTRAELLASNWTEVTHPEDRLRDSDALQAMQRGALDGYTVEKRLLRKDGSVVHCNVDVKCVRAADNRIDHFLDTIDDITQRKATERSLVTIGGYYAALSQCDEAIVHCTRESELFPVVCDAVVSSVGAGLAWIGMLDPRSRMVVPVAHAGAGREYLGELRVSADPDSPLSQGPVGLAILENRPVWSEDFATDVRTAPWRAQATRFGWNHVAALPLIRGNQPVGVLAIYLTASDGFNDRIRGLLSKMAKNISFALDALAREAERAAAIDALRRSELRFRQVFESSIDGILLAAPDGHILSANPAACRMLGYDEADLRALGPSGPADPQDPRWQLALEERARTGRFAGELDFLRKDGSRMPGEVSSALFEDSYGQKRGSVIVRDITERKHSEELLRKYAEQLDFYFSASPIIGYRLALQDGAWKTLWVSDNIEQQLGYTVREAMDPDWWSTYLHPDHREQAESELRGIVDADGLSHEYQFLHKDGRALWVRDEIRVVRDAAGAAITLVGAWSDITQRVQTEMELRKLSMAVEQSPESIVITNTDAQIEYVNDTFLRVTGFTREEVMGRNSRMLQSGATPRASYDNLWAALGRGEPWKGQFVNRRKDGSEYTEFAIIAPIRQRDGRITHYLAIKDDITERKRMGEELDTYRHHLEQLVDMRTAELAEARAHAEAANLAKSAFLANMSHEIRTPMNAIIGLTHLMLSAGTTPDQATRLRKIAASGQHLLSLVNDILDLSKIEAGKLVVEREAFDLQKTVGEAFGSMALRAEEKGLQARILPAPDLPLAVRGDPLRLGQVLLNLLSNAVKFTESGEIALHIGVMSSGPDGWVLRFDVTDTGIGLSDDQQSRLFRAFEQADTSTTRKYGGTGLGLAICQRLVQALGGKIGVRSTPGTGSSFWFELPFGRATLGEVSESAGALSGARVSAPSNGRPVREPGTVDILLVEDDPINQEVALELLRTPGYRVSVAVDGAKALEVAQSRQFDLVLMDLQMPVMDGFEATRRLRADPAYTRTPIIAMTANVFVEDQERCLAAGMDDFIAKPVDPDLLLATVARWLGAQVQSPSTPSDAAPLPADWQGALARIDGMDVAAGLRSVRGRWSTYERLLQAFLRDHGEDGLALQQELAGGHVDRALRRAHTLKGLAGTLGLRPLASTAEQLESLLRGGSADPIQRDQLADALARALAQLVALLRTLLPAQAGSDRAPVDPARLRVVLQSLERLLGEDDASALDLHDANAALLAAGLGAQAAALQRHIRRFEFDSARELVFAALAQGPQASHPD
jgi:two-component system sensor histidine kinase/response regulator